MEDAPKSFWGGTPELDPAKLWVSELDELGLRAEADVIYITSRAGIPLQHAEQYELWELAAATGSYLTETMAERDTREIDEKQGAYWKETEAKRTAIMAEAAERRKNRRANR